MAFNPNRIVKDNVVEDTVPAVDTTVSRFNPQTVSSPYPERETFPGMSVEEMDYYDETKETPEQRAERLKGQEKISSFLPSFHRIMKRSEEDPKMYDVPLSMLGMAGDILSLPTRGIAKFRGMSAKDPESALFKPEAEKIKGKIKEAELPGVVEKPAEFLTDMALYSASDPLVWLTAASKALKPISRYTQAAALRTPLSAAKGQVPLAETARKLGPVFTSKQLYNKADKAIKQGARLVDDIAVKSPNVINVDEAFLRAGEKIANDPLFMANRETAYRTWKKMVDEAAQQGLTGNQPVKRVLDFRKDLSKGQKLFNTQVPGQAPGAIAPGAAAKEKVLDEIYHELRKEIAAVDPRVQPYNDALRRFIGVRDAAAKRAFKTPPPTSLGGLVFQQPLAGAVEAAHKTAAAPYQIWPRLMGQKAGSLAVPSPGAIGEKVSELANLPYDLEDYYDEAAELDKLPDDEQKRKAVERFLSKWEGQLP